MGHMLQLCGQRFRCDGCTFGCVHPKTGRPLQKSWGWFSSNPHIERALNKLCTHEPHEHDVIEGEITSSTAVYPTKLCQAFAEALMSPQNQFCELVEKLQGNIWAVGSQENPEEQVSETEYEPSILEEPSKACTGDQCAASEAAQEAESSVSLDIEEPSKLWGPDKILARLRTIHANLGHPSNHVLCRMLKEAQASPKIIEAARNFECDFCQQRGHAAMHRPSAVTRPSDKWEVISVDTFWWYSPHRNEKGEPIVQAVGVSIMDEMTAYHTGCIVRTGGKNLPNVSGAEFKRALHQHWLKLFPQPKVIRFDDEGAFRDKSLIGWLEGMDIRPQYAAGEAAWQVGRHSRHLATLKETMTTLAMEQSPDCDLEELCSLSLGAKNRLHQIKGFPPINGRLVLKEVVSSHGWRRVITFRHKVGEIMKLLLNRICRESKVPKKRSSVRTHAVAFSERKKAKPVELNCLRLVNLFISIERAKVRLVGIMQAGMVRPALLALKSKATLMTT